MNFFYQTRYHRSGLTTTGLDWIVFKPYIMKSEFRLFFMAFEWNKRYVKISNAKIIKWISWNLKTNPKFRINRIESFLTKFLMVYILIKTTKTYSFAFILNTTIVQHHVRREKIAIISYVYLSGTCVYQFTHVYICVYVRLLSLLLKLNVCLENMTHNSASKQLRNSCIKLKFLITK